MPGASVLNTGSRRCTAWARTADHHAVTAFQPPDSAAGPDVDVIDLLRREFPGTADVVHVIGITAVDEDVSCLEMGQEVGDGLVDDGRGDHEPDRSRLVQFLHEVLQRRGSGRLFLDQLFHRLRRHVEDHALVVCLEKPSHHVGAHSAQSNHSELHGWLLCPMSIRPAPAFTASATCSPRRAKSAVKIDGAKFTVLPIILKLRLQASTPAGSASKPGTHSARMRARAIDRLCRKPIALAANPMPSTVAPTK